MYKVVHRLCVKATILLRSVGQAVTVLSLVLLCWRIRFRRDNDFARTMGDLFRNRVLSWSSL